MFSLHSSDAFHPLTLSGHRTRTIASFIDRNNTLYTISEDVTLSVCSFAIDNDKDGIRCPKSISPSTKRHYFTKDHARVESSAALQAVDLIRLLFPFSFSPYLRPMG